MKLTRSLAFVRTLLDKVPSDRMSLPLSPRSTCSESREARKGPNKWDVRLGDRSSALHIAPMPPLAAGDHELRIPAFFMVALVSQDTSANVPDSTESSIRVSDSAHCTAETATGNGGDHRDFQSAWEALFRPWSD